MTSTERRPRRTARAAAAADATAAPVDEFDRLREIFQARLRGEHLQLVLLSASLARADESQSWIFASVWSALGALVALLDGMQNAATLTIARAG